MFQQNLNQRSEGEIDWLTVGLYLFLMTWGWLNIFAAVYDPELPQSIFDLELNSGKQMLWIGTAVVLFGFIMLIDHRFWESFAYYIYGAIILLLVGVLIFGKVVAGSKSWIQIGSFALQPSEFAKFATGLALAFHLSNPLIKLENFKSLLSVGFFIALPALLILLQNDTGSTLVFGSLVLVLFREGMNPVPLVIGIICIILFVLALLFNKFILVVVLGVVTILIILLTKEIRKRIGFITLAFVSYLVSVVIIFSVDYFVNNVLQPHQQNRIKALVNPDADPLGFGWNVTQSKIAIGSGGFLGKGFLEGTQTKFDFVPEQHTDFIFCTIGEEWGWLGSLVLIALFGLFFIRLIFLAERQRSKFARIYGYCVLSIMFFHFMVNIGMTIGLFPVIGIPLPFFSYGGSSLWSFTILLAVFLNMDANRKNVLG
ncbi:MAG: rod shape-determining protein RodA [Cytophagales bacterium]